jgi:hypothetical protein
MGSIKCPAGMTANFGELNSRGVDFVALALYQLIGCQAIAQSPGYDGARVYEVIMLIARSKVMAIARLETGPHFAYQA